MPAKPLAQADAPITTPALLYQPAAGIRATNLVLIATNHTASDAWLTIHHDIDGTTYVDANAIESEVNIVARTTRRFNIPSMSSAGALATEAQTAAAISVTLYGVEVTV